MVVAICVAVFLRRHSLNALSRNDRILLLASGALALACLGAARNIAFFSLVAAPALATLIPQSQRTPERRRAAAWPAYAMVGAAIAGAILAVNWRWRDGGVQLGWRPLSSGVLRAVSDCSDPIFNPMEAGGPLMWSLPERRIFVDSRIDATEDLLARSRRADLFGDYQGLFREFNFNCALVTTTSLMHDRLLTDSSMRVAYRIRIHSFREQRH